MTTKLCPIHTSQHCYCRGTTTTERGLGWDHQQIRKKVLATANLCWVCDEPERQDDPFEADHVIPREYGGPTTLENIRAAHRSCNLKRRGEGGSSKTVERCADLPPHREKSIASPDFLIA